MRRLPVELLRDLAWLLRYRPRAFARLVSQVRCVRVMYRSRPDIDAPAEDSTPRHEVAHG